MGGKGPPRPSSSESDDWGDESWIVDCPCGVNYDDGEEMVECDECGVWVHTACCRVAKGLPTFVCDKCKMKKKLKESEESEVAQLLAELPSKSVSFEQDRNHHEKPPETYITGHQSSSEIPIEERVHVHGIPGGDPSFFVGAPEVCCRGLWKYSGYVPKLLKLEYKELPEPREDVVELLRELKHCKVFDAPMDGERKFAPLAVENVHATIAPMAVDAGISREEGSKEEVQVNEGTPKDRQRKSLLARKGEAKLSKNRHKPKVKEEKPQHNGKRVRNEGGLKERSSKKKPRTNGDVFKPEDGGDYIEVEGAPAQETAALKSPLSSPKNPKAMKKLAVQEFMDGDVILCSVCGKVEPLLDPTTGGSTGGGSDSLCQECEEVRRRSSPVSSKQEARSVKQEPAVLAVPSVVNSDGTLEVKTVSKRELDYCEAGTEAVRLRAEASPDGIRHENLGKSLVCNDSPTDTMKVDVDVTNLHKITGMHENLKGRDEKRRPLVKVEPIACTVNHVPVDTKIAKIPEALELPAVRTIVAAKSPGESAARAEDLRQGGAHVVASRPSSADDAETRTAGDASNAVCGNKQTVSMEGPLLVSSSDNSSKLVQLLPDSSTVPVVHSSPGSVPTEPENGNGSFVTIPQDRVVPPVVAETMEDRTSELSASTVITESRSQGSARTAGHLPASVRGKMHGDRCYPHLQRLISGAAAQQQASSQAGQSVVQFSASGNPKVVHNSVGMAMATSLKGSYGEEAASGKQHGQAQQDCTSPAQQVSKQGQPSRLHTAPTTPAQKSPAGLSETSSPSQPSPIQRIESDLQPSTKAQQGVLEPSRNESSLAASPKETKVATGFNSDAQVSKPTPSAQVTPVICQQARQLNGIGHVYVSRKHRENHTSKDPSGTLTSQALNSSVSNTKISVSSLKSPSSGTSSSSPTSPLVTTPSSKPQPSVKVPESLSSQKSLSGGLTPNASGPHSSSKLSGSLTSNVFSSKQVGTLQSSKSIPSLPASPQSAKVASMSKQSSRSNSLPVTKSGDGSNSTAKATGGIMSSRGLNHTGSSLSALAKENMKNSTSSKSASKASEKPAGAKPPSSGKSSHSVAPTKGSSLIKQHSAPGSTSLKASSTPSSAKHGASHHSKSMSHKDEKSSMPSAPPVPKAMSAMPPPPPHVSTKRSPPTVLSSSVATTLKDEELALLLHQELNSSPRVPRVPRVRQAGVSLQLVSPSLSSGKGSFTSAGSVGHKDHQLAQRKRTREDRQKDASREEGAKSGGKRSDENKMEDEKVSTEKSGRNGSVDGFSTKEKSGSVESNSRHHGFAKGNLSIIVPGNDEGQDGDKKSPAQSNVLTLPGLIDEVLSSGDHPLSYEDVCEAVLPHWPKLRKPNGERYAYPSHRLAVLDCLRNRPAWAHLVGRGPKTHPGRKRRRNEIKSLSDSDDEEDEQLGFKDSEELDTSKSLKRRKESVGDKRGGEATEDARRGGRQVRRRRRVEIEDGTDGEDEPVTVTKKASSGKPEVSKSDDGTSQEEEPEAESSPSSEEEASNYSTDDEEMVVHRGIRNRRRPTEESSSSEDEID